MVISSLLMSCQSMLDLLLEPDDVPFADPNTISNQQDINWHLFDLIEEAQGDLSRIIWVGDQAPPEDEDFKFWWDTERLELLIYYNDQWFPVAIPPAQAELLRQEIDALYQDTSQNKFNIALTQQELDGKVLELNEAREALKSEYDGKLATLEEELEQLAPSLERGSWTFTLNHPPGPGEYTMLSAFLDEDDQEALCNQTYADCLAAAGNDPLAQQACNREWDACKNAIDGSRVVTTDDWTQCEELIFNDVDMNGTTHAWGGIDSDHYIDVFNMNDENYMVGDIATHGGGTFSFDLVSSKGVASGPATIKIFKTEGTVDFDQYVRKAGDTMKGRLTINPDAATPPLYIYNHEDVTANTYSIRQFGVPYTDEEGVTQRDTVFYTTAGGDISGGVDWKPTRNQHLANVKYVHDQANKLYYPARFSWIVKTETSAGPVSGQIQWNKTSMSDSTEVRVHFKSYDGKLDLFDVADEKVVYNGPSNSSMMITGYYIGSDTDQKWKWKGTANITKITVYKRTGDCYFKCNLGSYKTSNATFNDGGRYYFTIPGLF